MSQAVKLVFCMRHSAYMRMYEPLLAELDRRGHAVKLLIRQVNVHYDEQALDRFTGSLSSTSWEFYSEQEPEDPRIPIRGVRATQDYVRYLHPDYCDAEKLRDRAAKRLSGSWRQRLDRWFGATDSSDRESRRWRLFRTLRWLDRLVAAPPRLVEKLRDEAPTAMLITPLVDIPSTQLDWMKAARQVGLPVLYLTASWDNLTNKGLVQSAPDATFVWNKFQIEEAVRYHRLDRETVFATGSQVFDRWFDTEPSTTAAEFATNLGLPDDREFLLYLCSSPFIAPDEVSFVERWIASIRGSDNAELAKTPILIRPHPQNSDQWRRFDPSAHQDVAIHPMESDPDKERGRRDFFDALSHARAVVGINTSAMIEAGIAGNTVYTIQDSDFRDTQDGTLHFRYLKEGGLVEVASDLDEHREQLTRLIRDGDTERERRDQFIQEFIRPHGLDRSATEILAETILEQVNTLAESCTPVSADRYAARAAALTVLGWCQWLVCLLLVPALTLARVIKKRGNPRPIAVLLRKGILPELSKNDSEALRCDEPAFLRTMLTQPARNVLRWLRRGSPVERFFGVIGAPLVGVLAVVGVLWAVIHRAWGALGVVAFSVYLLAGRYRREPRTLAALLINGRRPKEKNRDTDGSAASTTPSANSASKTASKTQSSNATRADADKQLAKKKGAAAKTKPREADPKSGVGRHAALRRSIQQLEKSQRRSAALQSESVEQLEQLLRLADSKKPLIIGPWLSEVGFELLYWIPFLQWAIAELDVDPARIIVVSRGGAHEWYQHLGGDYEDLLEYHTPDEFRRLNERRIEQTGGQKHIEYGDVDREFLAPILERRGITEFDVLHPMLMYGIFNPYWKRLTGPSFVDQFADFRRLLPDDTTLAFEASLPREFVAAKFYFSSSFPDTPANREFQRDCLAELGRDHDVVLLNTGLRLDDHSELLDGIPSRVRILEAEMLPSDNLHIQTRVIARSKLFVGTYGGFSYLAPFYGVPSIAFHSEEGRFVPGHIDIAYRAFRKLRVGLYDGVVKGENPESEAREAQFTALDVRHWPDLKTTVLKTSAVTSPPRGGRPAQEPTSPPACRPSTTRKPDGRSELEPGHGNGDGSKSKNGNGASSMQADEDRESPAPPRS